jgi:hypothetical protein
MESPFASFLIAWLLSFSGSAAFFPFYPFLMQQGYGVLPRLSWAGCAVAAGMGLILYVHAGNWSAKMGPLPYAVLFLRGSCLVPAERTQHGANCLFVTKKRARGYGYL